MSAICSAHCSMRRTGGIFGRIPRTARSTSSCGMSENRFTMNRKGEWSLSPAYDLTFAYHPGNRWISCHQIPRNMPIIWNAQNGAENLIKQSGSDGRLWKKSSGTADKTKYVDYFNSAPIKLPQKNNMEQTAEQFCPAVLIWYLCCRSVTVVQSRIMMLSVKRAGYKDKPQQRREQTHSRDANDLS